MKNKWLAIALVTVSAFAGETHLVNGMGTSMNMQGDRSLAYETAHSQAYNTMNNNCNGVLRNVQITMSYSVNGEVASCEAYGNAQCYVRDQQ